MKIEVFFYTPTNVFNKATLRNFLESCTDSIIEASRYGYFEPLDKQFSLDKIDDIFQLVEHGLIITDSKERNFIYVNHVWGGLTTWDITLCSELTSDLLAEIIKIVKLLAEEQQLIYAGFYPDDEFGAKHVHIRVLPGGGRATKFPGASTRNFLSFLPGIYWFNYFGQILSDALPMDRIRDNENLSFLDLSKGAAFHLNCPVDENNLKQRLENQEEIIRHLGENHFFNLENQERNPAHPEAFKKYLDEFKQQFLDKRKRLRHGHKDN